MTDETKTKPSAPATENPAPATAGAVESAPTVAPSPPAVAARPRSEILDDLRQAKADLAAAGEAVEQEGSAELHGEFHQLHYLVKHFEDELQGFVVGPPPPQLTTPPVTLPLVPAETSPATAPTDATTVKPGPAASPLGGLFPAAAAPTDPKPDATK